MAGRLQGYAEVARGGDLQRRKEGEPQRRQEGRPEEEGLSKQRHGALLPKGMGSKPAQGLKNNDCRLADKSSEGISA